MLRVWPGAQRSASRGRRLITSGAWITRSPTARASRRRSIPQREVRFTGMRSMRLSLLRLLSMTGVWSPRFHCCPATSRRSSRRPFIPRLCGPQRMSPRGKQSIMVSTALVRQGQRAPLFRYRRRMVARRARAQYAILARAIWGRPLRLRPLSTTDMNTIA